jgi:hypothetical protein
VREQSGKINMAITVVVFVRCAGVLAAGVAESSQPWGESTKTSFQPAFAGLQLVCPCLRVCLDLKAG